MRRRRRAGAAPAARRPRGSRSTSAASTSTAASSSTGTAAGAAARASRCSARTTARRGRRAATADQAEGERSYVYLPGGGRSRHLRLLLHEPAAGRRRVRVRALDVRPFDFSRSLADFFHAVAADERRGLHPRWLHREQSYWTPVGVAGGTTAAILNEEGLLEPDRGSFSLEPFLLRRRRARHLGRRRDLGLARAGRAADPVVDVAAWRSRADHDRLCRRRIPTAPPPMRATG